MTPAAFFSCGCPCGCTRLTKLRKTDSDVLARRARCSPCQEPAHAKEHPAPRQTKEPARPLTPHVPLDPEEVALDARIRKEQLKNISEESKKRWIDSLPEKFKHASLDDKDIDPKHKTVITRHLTQWKRGQPGTAGLVLRGSVGVGKCLTGDALILDPETGLRHTLEEVVKSDEQNKVYTMDENGYLSTTGIYGKLDTGYKETLQVTLNSGRVLTVTPEHPFLMPDGWRRADKLREGETVASLGRIFPPSRPVSQPNSVVDLMSIMLAEGCTRAGLMTFATGDDTILSIATVASQTLGFSVAPVKGSKYDYQITGCLPDQPVRSDRKCRCGCGGRLPTTNYVKQQYLKGHYKKKSAVRSLVGEWRMLHVLSKEKRLPDQVFRLPDAQLARFLTIFWMCDGHIDISGPAIGLASKGLIEDIQHVLLRFGIQTKIVYKAVKLDGKIFDSWVLSVFSNSWVSFENNIKIWGAKKERFNTLMDRKRNPNYGYPSFTPELQEDFKNLGLSTRNSKAVTKGKASIVSRGLREIPQYQILGTTHPWLISDDIWWDKIKSIKPGGIQHVYDLSIKETHCFVANDVIVHNTFMGICYANAAINMGLIDPSRILFGTEAELLSSAANSTFSEVDMALKRLISPRYRMIIIDDVGRGTWIREDMRPKVFSLVFDAAYRENKVVVVTTNLKTEPFRDYIGDGALDRLRSLIGFEVITITEGGSMREKITREALEKVADGQ